MHELALAAEDGEATFHHVVSNPAYSGLVQRRFDREHEEVVVTTVRIGRLDDILPADVVIRCLKIDVEGGELGVLTGGLQTLIAHRPYVIFEHGLGASDHYGNSPEMIMDVLNQASLNINLLSRWLNGKGPLSRAEFARQYETNENYYFLAHP